MRETTLKRLVCALLLTALVAGGFARADDDPGRPPDVSGKITEMTPGAQTITMGDRKKIVITVTRDTKVIYDRAKGRRRMGVGQQVDVWLESGTFIATQINVHN